MLVALSQNPVGDELPLQPEAWRDLELPMRALKRNLKPDEVILLDDKDAGKCWRVALADAVVALAANLAMQRGDLGENPRIDFKETWFDIASDETPEGITPDTGRPEYL